MGWHLNEAQPNVSRASYTYVSSRGFCYGLIGPGGLQNFLLRQRQKRVIGPEDSAADVLSVLYAERIDLWNLKG